MSAKTSNARASVTKRRGKRRVSSRKRTRTVTAKARPKPSLDIVPVAPTPAPIVDYLRKEALAAPSIQQTVQKHKEIRHFIRRMLKPGIDYDNIPGTNGKTLLQPGAEKIALWLKVRPYFETVENDLGNGHIEVVVRSHMLPTLVYDLIMQVIEKGGANIEASVQAIIRASELSNATASCSTMETNFRYRWADMRDEEGNPIKPDKLAASRKIAINMARWLPGKMKNGQIVAMTPAEKKAKMPAEYWIYQERVENPNIYDERNKVRQIGEKRGFVKSIKRMGALSEVFQEDPNEWPETLDVKPEAPTEEPFKAGVVERNDQPKAQTEAVGLEPPPIGRGHISLVWQDKDLAKVSGEDTKRIEDVLVGTLQGVKLQGKQEFILQACYVQALADFCARPHINIQITETQMEGQHKPKPASELCNEETGVIENAKQSTGKTTPNVQILFNKAWLYCYSKTIWPYLFQGVKKNATILVLRKEGRAPTVEGLVEAAGIRFEKDGKTPIAIS